VTTQHSIGVAVIGGGMAGRAHAAGYRTATTLFGTDRPDVRLVAIADTSAAVADDVAKRVRLRTSRIRLAGHCRRTGHRRGERRRRQPSAPRDRRRTVGGRQARAVREAAGRKPGRRRVHGRRRRPLRPRRRRRVHLPPFACGRADPPRAGRRHARAADPLQRALLVRLRARRRQSHDLALSGRTRHRGVGRRRQVTSWICPSSCADRSSRSAARPSQR